MKATAAEGLVSRKEQWRQRGLEIQAFIIKHWLPLVFAVAITWALAWPAPGVYLLHITILGDVRIIQEVAIGIVFFISGICLNTQDVKKAKGHVTGVVFGFVSVLFLTPMLGFVTLQLPLEPKLFAIGLTIFCVAPTTLGVGVALVRSCKGNDGIALLMTVGTNLLAVVTMPLMLKLLFLNHDLTGIDIKVDILNLFLKLVISILAPSVVGKAMRELWKPVPAFTTKYKVSLNIFSTTCLAFIIWQTMSGARELLFETAVGMIMSVICISVGLYLVYLAIHFVIISLLFRMPTPEAISVIIMSSQKSAPVAVTVISYITGDPATQGLLALPCIVGQLAQIFLGAGMAAPIAKRADAYYERQKALSHDTQSPPSPGSLVLNPEGKESQPMSAPKPDVEAPDPQATVSGAGQNSDVSGAGRGVIAIRSASSGVTGVPGSATGLGGAGGAAAAAGGSRRAALGRSASSGLNGSMRLAGPVDARVIMRRADSRVRGARIGLAAMMWPTAATSEASQASPQTPAQASTQGSVPFHTDGARPPADGAGGLAGDMGGPATRLEQGRRATAVNGAQSELATPGSVAVATDHVDAAVGPGAGCEKLLAPVKGWDQG